MSVNKYVVELIGTFFLVLTIGCTVLAGVPGVIAPLAIGAGLMVMVYACGHVSGAHFNPAVTVAAFVRGKCPAVDVVPYWIAQLIGAAAGSYAAMYLTGKTGPNTPLPGATGVIMLAEFLFTFALAWVILNVATTKANQVNSFYGLAIGFTVMAGAFAVGPISGGVFNPAVALAVGLMKLVPFSQLWMHVTADFAGAIAAAVVWKVVVKE